MIRRDRIRVFLSVLTIVAASLAVYADLFDAGRQFTAYDDNAYVTSQPLVKGFRVDLLPKIFDPSTSVASNYHPLTVASLGVDYRLFGPSARAFGLVNLTLHLLTSLLVLFLLRRLLHSDDWLAALGALWFAIHPLHVESVAWVSGRKDVLYGLWFVASALCYLRYTEHHHRSLLLATFITFVLSALSKPSAVVFPIVLIVIDIVRGRSITVRSLAEKAPFLVVSVVIGLLTIRAQTHAGAVADAATFSVLERIVIASYGFVMYWAHFLWPVQLNAFYPYPSVNNVFTLPWYAYAMPVATVAMISVPVVLWRRQRRATDQGQSTTWGHVSGGMLWYAVTIVIVLQLVSVGMVIMADRYTYIPMIGMLCVTLVGLHCLMQRRRGLALALISLFTILQGVMTYRQTDMWRNTETVWTSILERSGNTGTPDEVLRANLSDGYIMIYVLRGIHYFETNQPEKSYADLRHIMSAESPRTDAYERLGLLAALMGKIDESIAAYSVAISRPDASADAFLNRGVSYYRLGRRAEAHRDFEMGLTRNPTPEIKAQLEKLLML